MDFTIGLFLAVIALRDAGLEAAIAVRARIVQRAPTCPNAPYQPSSSIRLCSSRDFLQFRLNLRCRAGIGQPVSK